MDAKQENLSEVMDTGVRTDGTEWWKDVQTFDFGIDLGKLNIGDDGRDTNAVERFVEVSEETVKNMSKKKNAARTDESTKSGLKILLDYCHNADIVFPSATAMAAEMNSLLCKFYIAARTIKGEVYKINSLK